MLEKDQQHRQHDKTDYICRVHKRYTVKHLTDQPDNKRRVQHYARYAVHREQRFALFPSAEIKHRIENHRDQYQYNAYSQREQQHYRRRLEYILGMLGNTEVSE